MTKPLRQKTLGRYAARRCSPKILLAVLVSMLFAGNSVHAQVGMSGTYNVCSSCTYTSPQQIVDSLIWNGVSGPVTVKIAAGDYGPFAMNYPIVGASNTNTVTFEGAGSSGSSITRIVSNGDTTVSIQQGSHLNFNNIKFENTLVCPGWPEMYYTLYIYGSSDIQFTNCAFFASTDYNNGSIWNTYDLYTESCDSMSYYKSHFHGGYSPYSAQYTTNSIVKQCVLASGSNSAYQTYNGGDNIVTESLLDSMAQYGNGNPYSSNGEYGDQITRNKIFGGWTAAYISQPNSGSSTDKFLISNNMIYGENGDLMDITWYGSAPSYANLEISHNSFYSNGYYAKCLMVDNYSSGGSGHGFTVANNNFIATSNLSGDVLVDYEKAVTPSLGDVVQGNNYYNPGGGGYVSLKGNYYYTFSDYMTLAKSLHFGQYEHNLSTSYVSSDDLHYASSSPLPFGKNIGVMIDYDGDSRCNTFVTAGADEGKPVWNKPKSAFSGPKGKLVEGSPTIFKNGASLDSPFVYRWYVDGKFVSDSIDLATLNLKYPTVSISLVTYNCGGRDSLTKTFAVDTPTSAPVSDFISNKNVIRNGEVVKFNDISLNYPSQWNWQITPTLYSTGGVLNPSYTYVNGDSSSPKMSVSFAHPGKYRVCLSTANRIGAGNTECKSDYITVIGSYNVSTGTTVINDTKGYLYDDGGPDNDYTASWSTQKYKALIAPLCAKTVYLVFNYFDLYCGNDFIRIWDGSNSGPKSKEITTCTTNTQWGNGPGLTGGPSYSCYTTGITCIPSVTDTFVASSGKMYIEMTVNGGSPAKGFEAYFWSDIKPSAPPVATFDMDTNACTYAYIDLNSTSKGNDLTYQWFANDDYSYPIDDRANTNYAFLYPGDYDIALVVTNCVSSDTMIKTVHVTNPPVPKVDFAADNTNPTTSDVVYLSVSSKVCVDEYAWTITKQHGSAKITYLNGTNESSMAPQIMLSDTGCYDVKLKLGNASGYDSLTQTCFLTVRKPYCTPVVDNAIEDLGISEVQLNTIDNKSSQSGGYENYTPTVNTTLEVGVSYPFTISRSTSANSATRNIYIDWNGDGDFGDLGEVVATEKNSRDLSWTDTITVPAYAKKGATIMRIAITQGSQTNDPCENGYGEYEDYRLYIRDDKTKPVITLLGADTIKVEQGYAFTDPGATALDNLSGNITWKIQKTTTEVTTGSSFDILTPGTYIFSYDVTDGAGNAADTRKRVVIVTPDKTKPDLEVNSADTVIIGVFTSFTPPTYTANDLVDGNVTGDVKTSIHVDVNTVGTDTLHYSVTDYNGNTATKDIIVYVVDTTAPSLALKGKSPVYVDVNTAYTDSGVVYSDNYYKGTLWDAALLKGMDTTGSVDITKLGTYTISYTLTDPSGNKSITVNRTVIVQDTTAPHVVLKGDNNLTLDVNNKFMDEGLSITDNYYKQFTIDTEGTFYTKFPNGDATKLGTYTVIYKVTDGSNNVTTITRTINVVDRIAPVVALKGEPGVNVCRWDSLVDAGYTVTDNYYTGSGITVSPEGSFTTKGTQETGTYYLRYKAVDSSGNIGYSDWRAIYVKQCESGIQKVSDLDKSISIYPNPSEGLFTISADIAQQQEVKITVTNMLGQQIAVLNNQVLGNNQIQIDLRGQSAGVYLLNIYTDSQVVTKRITITR